MKKIIIAIVSIFVSFSLQWSASAQVIDEVYVVTPEDGANLTMAPKDNSPVIKKMKQGSRLEELKQEGDWLHVRYEGEEGYIKAEYVQSLDVDLIAAYKYYATVLADEDYYYDSPYVYTLLHDFTQDGLEELYIVEPVEDDQGFRHRIFSGEDVLLDETFRDGSLQIFSDENDYYIVRSHSWFNGIENYRVEDFGIQSVHEYVSVEPYNEFSEIIRSGSQSLTQQRAEWQRFLLLNFETNGESYPLYEQLDEMISYYTIDDINVTEEQWEEVTYLYERTDSNIELFFEGYFSLSSEERLANYEETVQKLYALYLKYEDVQVHEYLSENEIHMDHVNDLLQVDPIMNIATGEVDYIGLFYMAKYFNDEFKIESAVEEGYYKFPKQALNDWTYKYFGLYIDDEQLQQQFLNDEYDYDVKIEEDYYIDLGNGDAGTMHFEIVNQHALKNNYIAIEYAEDYPFELYFIQGKSQYLLVKKIDAADGSSYYPYLGFVESLEDIDYAALDAYTDALPLMQDYQHVEQQLISGAEVEVEEVMEEEEKRSAAVPLAMIGGLLLIALLLAVNVWRKKKGGEEV